MTVFVSNNITQHVGTEYVTSLHYKYIASVGDSCLGQFLVINMSMADSWLCFNVNILSLENQLYICDIMQSG